jgi:para-aminobenzoate N-oxygenase AurF
LVVRACQITRERRDLLSLTLPEAHIIKNLEEYKEKYSENWQKVLIQLVTAIVSEVFISDYLKLLSHEMSIQSFNRLTVDTHRCDELAHSSTFKELAKSIYMALSNREREFFVDVLPKPVRWFASLELDVWDSMLRQIEFSHTNRVIRDCKSINEENLARIDYSGLIALAEELEILNVQRGIDSFSREGLMI